MVRKNFIALLCLGFISNKLCAQVPLFANDKLNVVYIGIDNPISLYYNKPYDTVTTTNGSLSKISDGHYIWWPKEYRRSCLVLRSANGDSLAAAYFRVKRRPTPIPKLGGMSRGGLMVAGEFKAQQGIAAAPIEQADYEYNFELVGYKITYQSREGAVRTYYNKGVRFDDKAQDLINAAKSGDIYLFDTIQYRDTDGAVFDLPNIIITIK